MIVYEGHSLHCHSQYMLPESKNGVVRNDAWSMAQHSVCYYGLRMEVMCSFSL